MDALWNMMEEICAKRFDKGSIHWVDVTYIEDPFNFYVRPTSYRKYLQELEAYKPHSIDQTEAVLGTTVIYKSKVIKSFIRGKILSIEPSNTFEIQSLDFGCVDKSVPLTEMFKPLFNSNHVGASVLSCKLAYCYPIGGVWNKQSIDAMKDYVGEERAQIKIMENNRDKYVVELVNSCPDDIAMMLIKTDYASFGFDVQKVSPLTSNADYGRFGLNIQKANPQTSKTD
ncbi:uncharacterized protein LOC131849302 [Achroia grisella]|uniref:uncharacterized protein LOC131849302 n=1 Tax=Achroia grisella TaxID=688607 RepID=UPI0027D299CE|nr:uncharacterized protein LOC131849302 [Achroia grisella]